MSIWKNKNFVLLWLSSILACIGFPFFLFGQSWYIVNELNLESELGIVLVASSVPRLITMIFSGTLADRYDKVKLMYIADYSRAGLIFLLVLYFLYGHVTLWSFVILAVFFGIFDAFFWAASRAFLPSIVSKEQLNQANSILQMNNQISFIFSPMIAGVLINFFGYALSFSMTSIMLIFSGTCIYLINQTREIEIEKKSIPFVQSFMEGIKYVRKSPFLSSIIFCSAFINFFLVGPLQMGLPLFVKQILKGDSLLFSYMEASMAFGTFLGTLFMNVLHVRKKRGKFALVCLLISGLSFLGLSFSKELLFSLSLIGIMGMLLVMIDIPFLTVIQSIVPDEMLGRVMGIQIFSSIGLIPISYTLTSLFLQVGFTITSIMTFSAMLIILFSIFAYFKIKPIQNFD